MNLYRTLYFNQNRYLISDFCHTSGFHKEVKNILLHAQTIYTNNLREVKDCHKTASELSQDSERIVTRQRAKRVVAVAV